jgi:hypothetical protein
MIVDMVSCEGQITHLLNAKVCNSRESKFLSRYNDLCGGVYLEAGPMSVQCQCIHLQLPVLYVYCYSGLKTPYPHVTQSDLESFQERLLAS